MLTLGAIDTGNIVGETNVFGNSMLVFDGSGTLVVAGIISGQGSIEKLGSGTATLQVLEVVTALHPAGLRINWGEHLFTVPLD